MNANQLAQLIEIECHGLCICKEELKEAMNLLNEFPFSKLVVSSAQVDFLSALETDKKALKIAYPYGQANIESKMHEIRSIMHKDIAEVEYVANHSVIKNKDYALFEEELHFLVRLCHKNHLKVKVIIEPSLFSKDELAKLGRLIKKSMVDMVKCGIYKKVDPEDVLLLKTVLNKDIKIVVSEVESFEEALAYFKAGAKRISSPKPLKIINEFKEYYE